MKLQCKVVYRFIESAIRPGDILLSTNPTSITSWSIRAITRSPYSHAAICYRPPEFLEAIPAGVPRFNVTKFFIEDLSRIAIRRLKTDSLTTSPEIAVIAQEAQQYFGNDYWTLGALTALWPRIQPGKGKSVFCSHFVASAYEAAGIKLVQGKAAENVTPADIAESQILETVTNLVLKPVSYDAALLSGIPFEKGSGDSPHRKEIVKALEVRDQVNLWLRRQGLPEQANFNDLLNFLRDSLSETRRQEMDKIFSRALEETGYLEVLHQRYPCDDPIFQISYQLRHMLGEEMLDAHQIKELREDYRRIYAQLKDDLEEKSELRLWYENAWDNRRLKTFRLLADNQWQVMEVGDKLLREFEACLRLLRENNPPLEQRSQ